MKRSNFALAFILLAALCAAVTPAGAEQDWSNFLREQFLSPYKQASTDSTAEATLVRHDIDDFGSCSFFAKRGVRWSQDFENGSRLELRCDPNRHGFLPGFHLVYYKPGAKRFEIGRCIFDEGFNEGWYYTSSNPNVKGPVRVEWVNVDGGKNDGGGRHLDQQHVTGREEPYVDVVRWTFDPARGRLECVADKYKYATSSLRLPSRPAPLQNFMGAPVPELRRSFVTFEH